VYELPVGPGRRYLSNHWLGHVAGGWTVGVLGTLLSGAPFTVTTQTNTTNAFSAGAQRADLVGDPELPSSERTLTRWFNTDAFAQPATFTFGNSGRGIVRGDGIINFDVSLAKNVALGGARTLQLRVEAFNAFNHPNSACRATHLRRAELRGCLERERGANDSARREVRVLVVVRSP
jgi:hypothetical protein